MQGRDYVIPDDIKDLAEPALAHRIIVNPAARMRNIDARSVVRELLTQVPVPGAATEAPAASRPGRSWRTRQAAT